MTVHEAKEVARDWVEREGSLVPGFSGAFFAGSINWKAPEKTFPPGSDVDVFIIVDADDVSSLRTRKIAYGGLVMEPAYYPLAEFRTPDAVLADYRVACHLTVPSVISDPRSVLVKIQHEVRREYGRRKWIRARCDGARENITWCFGFAEDPSWPINLFVPWGGFCVFAPRIAALADLRDPTAKRSLVVSGEVFTAYGEQHCQDLFFQTLGIGDLSPEEALRCLDESLVLLDMAIECHATPSEGDNFVSRAARDLYVQGVHAMMAEGHHREVITFIDMLVLISLGVLKKDAPDREEEATDLFWKYMMHHGVYSESDHRARIALARSSLDEIMMATERIIMANRRAFD